MENPTSPPAVPATPPRPAPLAPRAPQAATPQRLPRSVDQLLRWLDPKDYGQVETVLCHLPLSKDLVNVIRLVDTIWSAARNAEHRSGPSRIRGVEMDAFRDRLDEGIRGMLTAAVELGHRAGFTDKLQKHSRTLRRYGFSVKDLGRGGMDEPKKPNPDGIAEPSAA